MAHAEIIEIIAILTGIVVITIETVIIVMLKKHVSALDSHLSQNEKIMEKFQSINENHLNHLNSHSHEIESMLKEICNVSRNIPKSNAHRQHKIISPKNTNPSMQELVES